MNNEKNIKELQRAYKEFLDAVIKWLQCQYIDDGGYLVYSEDPDVLEDKVNEAIDAYGQARAAVWGEDEDDEE